jgi:SAM-dependent methyltransferase
MKSYLRLCTEYYDIDKPTAPEDALAFYMGYAEMASGPILEAMSGSGRFLIPLLSRGFDIDGVDASPHMLQACRNHCERLGLKPTLYEQFLHELDLPRQYALIFISVGSFSLLVDWDETRESVKRLYEAMLPGATLVVHAMRPGGEIPESAPWGGRWVERPDGARILLSSLDRGDDDPKVSHGIGRYELIKDGKLLETEFEDFHLRRYEPSEVVGLLEEAGFVEIKAFGWYDRHPPADDDWAVIVECRKKEAPA